MSAKKYYCFQDNLELGTSIAMKVTAFWYIKNLQWYLSDINNLDVMVTMLISRNPGPEFIVLVKKSRSIKVRQTIYENTES